MVRRKVRSVKKIRIAFDFPDKFRRKYAFLKELVK